MQQGQRAESYLVLPVSSSGRSERERERGESAEQHSQKTQMSLIYVELPLAVQVSGSSAPELS